MKAGKLIAVIGNAGVGKTTFVERLCAVAPFATGVEQHSQRPFHARMSADPARHALANQVDFLLWRAAQERELRQAAVSGLVDGGLELDYRAFTPLMHHKGYLDAAEMALCDRLYAALRQGHPRPDLLIRLTAPLETVITRHRERGRAWEVAQSADLHFLESRLTAWFSQPDLPPVLTIPFESPAALDPVALQRVAGQIQARLSGTNPSSPRP